MHMAKNSASNWFCSAMRQQQRREARADAGQRDDADDDARSRADRDELDATSSRASSSAWRIARGPILYGVSQLTRPQPRPCASVPARMTE